MPGAVLLLNSFSTIKSMMTMIYHIDMTMLTMMKSRRKRKSARKRKRVTKSKSVRKRKKCEKKKKCKKKKKGAPHRHV